MKNKTKTKDSSLAMHLPFVAASLIGFAGILIVRGAFDSFIKGVLLADGVTPIANDNFYLYYNVSTILCAVLLALTLLSSGTYVLQSAEKSKFSRLTVTIAPLVCSAAMVLMSAFYAYLTYSSEMPIVWYLIVLGVCEGALFLFPLTLSRLVLKTRRHPSTEPALSHKTKKRTSKSKRRK